MSDDSLNLLYNNAQPAQTEHSETTHPHLRNLGFLMWMFSLFGFGFDSEYACSVCKHPQTWWFRVRVCVCVVPDLLGRPVSRERLYCRYCASSIAQLLLRIPKLIWLRRNTTAQLKESSQENDFRI